MPTPVDELGLVKVSELVASVKATVAPEYVWPLITSTHHLYWPEAWYPHRPGENYNPGSFRNLGIHKGEFPRVFENWLHIVTEPPPVPAREVMEYRVEGWRVARNLFRSAREVVQWEKKARRRAKYVARNPGVTDFRGRDEIAEEYMTEIIGKHFEGLEKHMSELGRVPPEFRLVEPMDSPQELAKAFGRIIVPPSLPLVSLVHSRALGSLAA